MLSDEFKFIKGLPKKSASKTDFWKIKRKKDDGVYALKIFVDTVDGINHPFTYPLLKHEIKVYKFLKKYLIDEHNVRNILSIYAIGIISFNEIVNLVYDSTYNNLNKYQIKQNLSKTTQFMLRQTLQRGPIDMVPTESGMPNLKGYDIDKFSYAYIITQFVEGTDLIRFMMNSKKLDAQQFCKYISIITLTLYQMMSVGVNENDLHMGNILMTNKTFGPSKYHSKVYLLVFDKTTFIINNDYTPIIYDFDRASLNGKYVSRLEYFKHGGNCPSFHEKRDFIRLLCGLIQHIPYVESKDRSGFQNLRKIILYQLIKDETLRKAVTKSDNSCWMSKGDTSTQCDDKLLNSGMIEPDQIVRVFFKLAKFKNFSTKKLINGSSEIIDSIADYLYTKNKWTNTKNFDKYISANIQFVGSLDISTKSSILKKLTDSMTRYQ